jgi:BCCT, betaine/carnitine/choline family transporter
MENTDEVRALRRLEAPYMALRSRRDLFAEFPVTGESVRHRLSPTSLSGDRTGKRFKGLAMPERKMNPPVFLGSSAIIAAFLILGIALPGRAVELGPDESEPDYSYLSWIAMLFAAGMGIGLMYFAVAEPIAQPDRKGSEFPSP